MLKIFIGKNYIKVGKICKSI